MKQDKSHRPKTLVERTLRVATNSEADVEPQTTKWRARAQWLRNHPFVVIMETAGLLSLVFAAALFIYELKERQQARIAASWQTLATLSPGKSGKKEALEFLNAEYFCVKVPDAIYVALNRSQQTEYSDQEIYEAMTKYNNIPKNPWRWCWKNRQDLTSVRLGATTNGGPVDLRGVDLAGANLSHSDFSNALLSNANFSRATFFVTNLSGAKLHNTNFDRSYFFGANLADANLSGSFKEARFYVSNFDNAEISDALDFRELKIVNSSFNNTKISMSMEPVLTSNGEFALAFVDEDDFCENTSILAWAFETNLPELFPSCLNDKVWLYEKSSDEVSVITPDEIQRSAFERNGFVDAWMITPDHNGPAVPTRGSALIVEKDRLEKIWSTQMKPILQ